MKGESSNTDVLPVRKFSVRYTLGEAQYSGKKKRVTVFYTFLLRGR